MERVICLSARFRPSLERAGIAAGTPLAKRVAATLNALARAPKLPENHDQEGILPPSGVTVWVRRVDSANVWLYFRVSDHDDQVTAITLVTTPPHPLDY